MLPRSPAALGGVVLGLLLLVALTAAGRGRGDEPRAELRLVKGTLALSNSLGGAAVLSASNLAPGDTASGTVQVSNTGSLDGLFSLEQANVVDTPGPFGGRLSERLQLTVEELRAGGSTAVALYSGVLAQLGTRPLGRLRAGETRAYRFRVSFPDGGAAAPGLGDNRFQSASLKVDFVWKAGADDGGSGGGPGGGRPRLVGGGGPAQPMLTLTLTGKRKQRPLRRRRLVVKARCSVICKLAPTLRVKKARKLRKLRARKSVALARKPKKLIFKLSRRKLRALRRTLRQRKRAVAIVRVTARTDTLKVTAKRRVILRR